MRWSLAISLSFMKSPLQSNPQTCCLLSKWNFRLYKISWLNFSSPVTHKLPLLMSQMLISKGKTQPKPAVHNHCIDISFAVSLPPSSGAMMFKLPLLSFSGWLFSLCVFLVKSLMTIFSSLLKIHSVTLGVWGTESSLLFLCMFVCICWEC